MFDRWRIARDLGDDLLIARPSAVSGAERGRALPPGEAVSSLSEYLRDPGSRNRVLEICAGCTGAALADLGRRSAQDLAAEVSRRIEGGSLLVIPLPRPAIRWSGASAAPKAAPAAPKGDEVEEKVTVAIKDETGLADPPVAIPISHKRRLKAVPSAGSGSYQWTTASPRVSIEGDATAQVVVIAAGASASPGPLAETIQLVFTPTGKPALAPVSHKLSVAGVVFSADPGHAWGYDAYEAIPSKNQNDVESTPTPDPKKDFVSVKVGEAGKVKLVVSGVEPAKVFLASSSPAKAKPKAEHPAAASCTVEIDGAGEGEADLEAHLESPTGPVAATVGIHVLKEKTFKAEIFSVEDSTSNGTKLGLVVGAAAVKNELNRYYKQAVGTWDVRAGGSVDARYDLNKNGKLDMEPGVTTPEQQKIIAACAASAGYSSVIVVKDLRWCYYLARDAAATDREIWIKPYGGYLDFIGTVGYTFEDDAGHSVAATVSSVDTATGKVALTAPIGAALKTADHAALIWPLGGLSGNPLWVGEKPSLAILNNYIAHELGHTLATWADVCERNNLMHGGSDTGEKLRHRPIEKYYSAGANEEQWTIMPR